MNCSSIVTVLLFYSSANLPQTAQAKPNTLATIAETGLAPGSTESKHDYDRNIIFRRVYISSRDNEEFLEVVLFGRCCIGIIHFLGNNIFF